MAFPSSHASRQRHVQLQPRYAFPLHAITCLEVIRDVCAHAGDVIARIIYHKRLTTYNGERDAGRLLVENKKPATSWMAPPNE